jgi:hypothetical protein
MAEQILQNHRGWKGAFTRAQAEGAWPAGTRVRKAGSEPGDTHLNGAEGVILGSLAHRHIEDFVLYFVEWDSHPKHAIAVANHRLEPVKEHAHGTSSDRVHRNP